MSDISKLMQVSVPLKEMGLFPNLIKVWLPETDFLSLLVAIIEASPIHEINPKTTEITYMGITFIKDKP